MYYAGIDIGTSKVKFVVYNNDSFLKEYEKKQSVIHNEEGNLINAKKIIENVYSLFKEAFSDYPEIAGVSITSFGESFVCLDENDEPLIIEANLTMSSLDVIETVCGPLFGEYTEQVLNEVFCQKHIEKQSMDISQYI